MVQKEYKIDKLKFKKKNTPKTGITLLFTTHAKYPVFLKAKLFTLDSEFPGVQSQEENKTIGFQMSLRQRQLWRFVPDVPMDP